MQYERLWPAPVSIAFDPVAGPAINHFQQVEAQGAIFWEPLLFAIALAESYRVSVGWANPKGGKIQGLNEDYSPGDLGFDPLGLLPQVYTIALIFCLMLSLAYLDYGKGVYHPCNLSPGYLWLQSYAPSPHMQHLLSHWS